MDNRILIKSIHIKNFRSIRSEKIDVNMLNIFVGVNDVGKSNFLKALNLFFNNETDYGQSFSFEKDFTFLFPKKSHSTKEIVIEIKFSVPDSYSSPGVYSWKKIWRSSGLYSDKITTEKGENPSKRSKVPYALRIMRYRYVPAVKSKEYYKELLRELYITVSSVINSPLKGAINDFSEVLQTYTLSIRDEVLSRLGMKSVLSMPDDLSDVFKAMIFQTQNVEGINPIPLDMRGDGVQARHIPIILKYIENQDRKTTGKGAANVLTIWGYEEPENGVELSKAFEMSKSFLEYSNDIQIFTTSHSPAFYTRDEENSTIFFVSQDREKGETKAETSIKSEYISETMGLLPIVAPYVAEKERQIRAISKEMESSGFKDVDTIAVEGISDKEYILCAIKLFSEKLTERLNSGLLRVYTKPGEGGCKALYNYAHAWLFMNNKSRLILLFDKDNAGVDAYNDTTQSSLLKGANAKIKSMYLIPSDEVIALYKKHINLSYEIEHLLSVQCWNELINKGWCQKRLVPEYIDMFGESIIYDKSIQQLVEDTEVDEAIRNTIVTYNPHKDKKHTISQWVVNIDDDSLKREYLSGLRKTVSELEKLLCDR